MNCPKCKAELSQGFVVDSTYGGRLPSQWAPGPPDKSIWTGTKLPAEGIIPIAAFRCPGCGYLELYARHEFASR
jgi:hypothetical protein